MLEVKPKGTAMYLYSRTLRFKNSIVNDNNKYYDNENQNGACFCLHTIGTFVKIYITLSLSTAAESGYEYETRKSNRP